MNKCFFWYSSCFKRSVRARSRDCSEGRCASSLIQRATDNLFRYLRLSRACIRSCTLWWIASGLLRLLGNYPFADKADSNSCDEASVSNIPYEIDGHRVCLQQNLPNVELSDILHKSSIILIFFPIALFIGIGSESLNLGRVPTVISDTPYPQFADVWVLPGYHIEYLRISEYVFVITPGYLAKYPQQVMHTQISRLLEHLGCSKKKCIPFLGVESSISLHT